MAIGVGWAAASLLGAGHLHRRAAARHRADLADLLERIAGHAEALAAAPPDPISTPPAAR